MNALEQRMAALDAANRIRIERANLHLRVTAGEVTPRSVLEVTPACAEKVEVFAFLQWLPHTGRRRAMQIMRRAGLRGYRQLAELTDHQRAELIKAIEAADSERGLS